jgi:hypothetical protein
LPRRRSSRRVRALFRAANREQERRNAGARGIQLRRRIAPSPRALYVVTDQRIVKVGITNSPERRLAEHRRQGLWKVVYILRAGPRDVRVLENNWKNFIRLNPHLSVTREVLPDGYTEAMLLTDEARAFIDRLVGKPQN